MQERLKARPVAVQLPDGSAEDFRGIVDLVEQRYLQFDTASLGREIRSGSIPAALQEEASQRRAAMIETLAELHDPLAEAWLEERAITSGEIRSALRAVTIRREAVPVLCGAALRNVGIQPLLDAVCDYLPSPLEVPPVMGHDPATGEEISLPPNASAPFSALVFKVSAGASADLFYLRVYSGNLDAGERVLNPRTGEKERLRRILRMHADRGEPVERLEPGDIVAAAALHGSRTGDTLCSDGKPLLLEPIRFPSTVVTVAVEPRSGADRERFQEILPRLLREDPTLESHIDPDTGQTLLSGMGELHLEVVLGHLQRDFGLQLNSGNPRVSYRETALRKAGGEAEYSKLVGGEPLSAWVRLLFEPLENPSMPVEVLNGLLPGVVSAVMARGILESVRNAADGGGLFGYPVSGVRIHVSGARYAEVGQPEIALNSATSLAFREALRTAGSAVLEPYGRLEIRVPEEYLGAVVKTLHPRRAVVEETIVQRSGAVVRGVAPIAEMFGYLTSLRSHTQGRGTYSLEPLDFRPVPENLVRANHQRLYD
jgi:elongation factor G